MPVSAGSFWSLSTHDPKPAVTPRSLNFTVQIARDRCLSRIKLIMPPPHSQCTDIDPCSLLPPRPPLQPPPSRCDTSTSPAFIFPHFQPICLLPNQPTEPFPCHSTPAFITLSGNSLESCGTQTGRQSMAKILGGTAQRLPRR